MGSSPWGREESDTTERLHFDFSLPCTGGGYGNPLQYSCLENPMDGGAWRATVHGVAKSRTRLSDFPFTFHYHALEKEMATHSSVLAWRTPGMGSVVGCCLCGRTESDTTEATQQQQQQQQPCPTVAIPTSNQHPHWPQDLPVIVLKHNAIQCFHILRKNLSSLPWSLLSCPCLLPISSFDSSHSLNSSIFTHCFSSRCH